MEAAFAGAVDGAGVGVELELVPYRRAGGRRPPHVAEMAPLVESLPAVSFEPGGQVELSPPPRPALHQLVHDVEQLRCRVEHRLAPAGIAVEASGTNDRHGIAALGLQLDSRRYREMDAWFAGHGAAGAHFMRRTAGLQVCVDLRPGDDGALQWRAAHAVAPLLAAAFSNSLDNERLKVWLALDVARTGHGVLGRPGRNPVEEYVAFAAGAPPLSRRFAGATRAPLHLTTLFPAVRPRGRYLEIRAIDAVDGEDLVDAVLLTVLLASDPRVASSVSELVEQLPPDRWASVAVHGLEAPWVRTALLALLAVAREALPDISQVLLPSDAHDRLLRLDEALRRGRTPASARARRLVRAGTA